MMEGRCPIKFRLLEKLEEGPFWNYEIVPIVQSEYGMEGDYGKAMINYDLVELVSAGFLKEDDCKADEEGTFQKGRLLVKYSITSLGRSTAEDLKKKVGKGRV